MSEFIREEIRRTVFNDQPGQLERAVELIAQLWIRCQRLEQMILERTKGPA